MKKWILFLFVGFSALSFQACDNKNETSTEKTSKDDKGDDIDVSKVPQAVQSAFAARYSGATDVKWETAKENGTPTYKVKFDHAGTRKNAEFGSDGSFIKE